MAKNKGSAWIPGLITIAVLTLAAGGGWYYFNGQRTQDVEYKTADVANGDLVQVVTATGQINPMTNVLVGSQVSGNIQKLYVDYNDHVTNGQVVAQLDPANYKAQAAQIRADLENAKAALELAQAEEERTQALYQASIVAKADLDSAVAALHQAQAQVESKEAALNQALVNLAYTTIYSPVDGIVISRNVDVGQTVAASLSAPTLYVIANDLARMQIDALVSEADIGNVEPNQKVNFTVDAYPLRTFQGIVTQIRNAPQTNQNVITYDTVIKVDNSDLKLRPGMTANVSIITAERDNVLKIPNAALRWHPPENLLASTNATAANNTASNGEHNHSASGGTGGTKPHGNRSVHTVYLLATNALNKPYPQAVQIKTGINDGISTQVVDGLKEGDVVITSANLPGGETAQSGPSNPFGGGMRRF